jgi:iron complex outermembrane receptor protein
MRNPTALALSALIVSLALPHTLLALESDLVLEEVIVTATKREQSMQDVSVAVTALGADLIQAAAIASSEDLTQLVPSLNLQKGSNVRQQSFNIRGIGTQSFSSAVEPSVSTMVDGVVMGRSGLAFMRLMDIERVEVLRGPQGTLFGKNSTGGVVHIITRDPTEEFSGEVMGSVWSGEEYRAGFTVSGPLSNTLGFRLTASGSDMDGYTRNFYDGDYLNGREEWSVRGKLRWDPTDTLTLKWASDFYDAECDCTASPMRSIEPVGGNDATVQEILDRLYPAVPGDENTEVNQNSIPGTAHEQSGHSLEANWDIGDYTLTSITAVRSFEIDGRGDGDLDGQPIETLGFDQTGATDQDQFTQEIRLTSPAQDDFNYVVGLFYFDQEVERQFIRSFEIVPDNPGEGIATFEADTRNWAAFGEATWHINDYWRLIFGARYTEDEIDFIFERTREGFPVGVPEPVPATGQDTDEDDLSGKLAVQWDFNEDSMAYLSFTEGYKGPAFDLTFGTDPTDLQRVEPETSESWELGLKTRLWDGRVQLNVALFDAVYEDFQSQAFFDPDGIPDCPDDNPGCDPNDDPGSFLLINAGEVSTQGVEVDFVAQVTGNLRLMGGLAVVDAEIDDYPAGLCSEGQKIRGECPDGLQDLSGGDLPFSPDIKVNVAASYVWPRDNLFDVMVNGSVRYQDEVQYGLHQDPHTVGDSYTIVDASISLQDHSDRWEVTGFVKNLTDEFYPGIIYYTNNAFVENATFHRYGKLAERTYGLELRYRW